MDISRRTGLFAGGALAAGSMIPGKVLGANEKLSIACVGIAHMGYSAVKTANEEHLAAICDVDWRDRSAGVWKKTCPIEVAAEFPDAAKFNDFREMIDSLGDKIDAVFVATPDHAHFPAAMAAMEKGKHVFVQKPLAHNIWQTRTLQKAMHKYGVQTNMGNQGHTFEGMRLIVEWVQAGILGEVREVHCWTDRPTPNWFPLPSSYPPPGTPVPDGLEWDLWQGPVPSKKYSPEYMPTRWRGWWDYGVGALGDIGCHCLDAPFWALELGMPSSVEVELDQPVNDQFTVYGAHVIYNFPARGGKPPVKLHWYEGRPRPPKLPGMTELLGNGMYMVGSEETLYAAEMRPQSPMLWPRENMVKYKDILKLRPLSRVSGGPIRELIGAIKGGPACGSNFDYAAPLTEVVLLGGIAIRTGKRIEWDAKNMRITNHPELNALIKEPVRKGWSFGENL
ncbi:Gfo/Idh/MocA family protein [Pontiella sulfatireligans]|uniref:Scyllo-inositol 2-dehydrogenase (NADP(+)) n=1 Tax=Pontiella sulfatireligans TaxID=2750658 RepID=A0A6C2UU88_9BACT|nr:Gfo/Idh/MocA family oxidoreductase [Pontiella sulfatireligans]VGO22456.1 scyllo-inositol 2-dehydrogenase (NADP(+)) [Pontiella sulfatireligans]